MVSTLFQVTVTKKNRKTYAKTLLLTAAKVLDFYEDTDGGTVFYYAERQDRRLPAVEYKTAINSAAFHALLRGAANEQFVYIEVTEIVNENSGAVSTIPSGRTYRVNIDNIIDGYDRDTRSSYIRIERGPFEVLRFKTSHLIAEIDDISSISYSISVSGSY